MTDLHMSRGTGKEAALSRSHGPLMSLSTGESHHVSHLSLHSRSAVTLPHGTLRMQTTSMCFLFELRHFSSQLTKYGVGMRCASEEGGRSLCFLPKDHGSGKAFRPPQVLLAGCQAGEGADMAAGTAQPAAGRANAQHAGAAGPSARSGPGPDA